RFDAAENRAEIGLAHPRQDFRTLGDVQRGLAGKAQDETRLLLPLDQMWQQVECRLAVADEIIVDEIDRAADAAFEQLVELGGDLLRRLQARITAIKPRYVAKFALVGTSARILNAAEQITLELGQLIGGKREACHVETLDRLEHDLLQRARRFAGETRNQFVGRIAEFTDMQVVERRII